jgi:hypothetical protein
LGKINNKGQERDKREKRSEEERKKKDRERKREKGRERKERREGWRKVRKKIWMHTQALLLKPMQFKREINVGKHITSYQAMNHIKKHQKYENTYSKMDSLPLFLCALIKSLLNMFYMSKAHF